MAKTGHADSQVKEAAGEKTSRRGFLTAVGAGGAALVAGGYLMGRAPAVLRAQDKIAGKESLVVHSPRPMNLETPAHLLDDDITPIAQHFVRNNGLVPEVDAKAYRLKIDGEVRKELELSLEELQTKFPVVKVPALIECGGNGRAFFTPKVSGNQWNFGAVACAEWTGVRLSDLLNAAGLKKSAVYTGHYGLDPSLNPDKVPSFSRGIPIDKAMEAHTVVAFKMNGEDIPAIHGYPVRLVVPGWVGSASQKWLNRVWVRDQVHDSDKMTGSSYRNPKYQAAPGAKVPNEDYEILTAWRVKSMITNPADGTPVKAGQTLNVRGHAWAGEDTIKRVDLSFDMGASWVQAKVHEKAGKYAWHRFEFNWTPRQAGYYEIMARATDDKGLAQPFYQPWNPRGYMGNVVHRVAVQVA